MASRPLIKFKQGAEVAREIARLHRNPDPRAIAVRSAALRSLAPVLTATERRADRSVAEHREQMAVDQTKVRVNTGAIYSVGYLATNGSKPPRWTRFLFRLEQLHAALNILELGTNAGVSGAALAHALPNGGHLWSLDVNLTEHSSAAFDRAGLADRITVVDGYFDDTLAGVLEAAGPLGLAFIDGNHHEEATLRYFDQVLPHLAGDALVVFDDVHWSDGMDVAWQSIRAHPSVAWSVDLQSLGVVAIK